jgi:O-methyltransferase involved in polyketide biosynthesis
MNVERMQESVSETLFIPLAVRASEKHKRNPIFADEKAIEIIKKMKIGDIIVDGGGISNHGILARTKVIDDEIIKINSTKHDMVIINLGAGLDTRICRIENKQLKWFELDLPDVIKIRKNFFEENERIHYIAKSVLDETWVREIDTLNGDNIIIIAEGLLMYFTVDDVRHIFDILTTRFPGAHMFFDVVHGFFVGKGISSTFLWGLDKAIDIENINPNIRLINSWSTGDLFKDRQSLLLRIMNVLPSTRNRSQILHICFLNNVN